jgi:hypothetical protein
MSVKVEKFNNFQEAWEELNKGMVLNEKEIMESGLGGIYGTEFLRYNTLAIIDKPWVDPEFDFGAVLGYKIKKWTTLVRNYVDINYLDILRNEIASREKKYAKSYNYAFHFSNKYGGGKDCLISLIFSKRLNSTKPTVFFNVRISEMTCRLIFDFLLVQRIIEYVYGEDREVEVEFFAPAMYVTAERLMMMEGVWKYKSLFKQIEKPERFQSKIISMYKEFAEVDANTIKRKSNKRCAIQLQYHIEGKKPSNFGHLQAKNLHISRGLNELPKNLFRNI